MLVKPLIRLATVMLILLVAASTWAGTTGKIAGKVTDKTTGEPLPGVNVIIVGTTVGAATNIQGEFFIINVRPEVYTLKASLIGYRPVEVKNVQVSVDLTTTVDFQLGTETIEMGTVTVEAVRPLIEKDITSSRTTITPSQITDSAVNGIIAQSNLSASSVLGSFRGGRQDNGEVVYMLDGVNLSNPLGESRVGNNPGSGTTALATIIPNESIAEAEVLSGGFGAEYPSVQSGVINIVTKEGSDKFTGKIKSKSSPEVLFKGTSKLDKYNRNKLYDMRQHEFGLSGPIPISNVDVPGKLSFSASGVYTYVRSYQDERAWEKSQSMQGKLIYQITSSKKLTFSGLKSFDNFKGANRSRMLYLTWGSPTYYTKTNVNTANNQLYDTTVSFTPYAWILAPNHTQAEADTLYFRWLAGYTNDTTWNHRIGAYTSVPDSLLNLGRDYIDSLYNAGTGFARSYSNYDMTQTLGMPETWSYSFAVNFNSTISSKSYYELSFSRFLTAQRARVYDPWDRHPMSADQFLDARIAAPPVSSIESSLLFANPMYISRYSQDDHSIINTLKGDFTSQVNSYNQMKMGAEVKFFDLLYDYRSYASGNNEYNSQYNVSPYQIGAYAQDKIETQGMIVNVGMRYDFFNPKTVVPFNPLQPLNPGFSDVNDPRYGQTSDLNARLKDPVPAKKKQQISPRVGVSFPITENDVLHVTYGHYFQLPVFDDFYTNHAFDLRGAFKYIGNPNLTEEKTVSYEAGIEHGFNDYLKLAVTGYFKDIADLVNHKRFINNQTGDIFWINTNSDYARVKGFEITFTQRPWHNFSGVLTYTYQNAMGKASNKTQGFLDAYYQRKPRTEDFPLDWDQRNTAKADINYRIPPSENVITGDWGLDVVFTFGSGGPYSSATNVTPPNLPPINDKRMPNTWQIDLRVDKGVKVYKNYTVDAFLEVTNLTDRANIINILDVLKYDITGYPAGAIGDPSAYSAPRRVLLGLQMTF